MSRVQYGAAVFLFGLAGGVVFSFTVELVRSLMRG